MGTCPKMPKYKRNRKIHEPKQNYLVCKWKLAWEEEVQFLSTLFLSASHLHDTEKRSIFRTSAFFCLLILRKRLIELVTTLYIRDNASKCWSARVHCTATWVPFYVYTYQWPEVLKFHLISSLFEIWVTEATREIGNYKENLKKWLPAVILTIQIQSIWLSFFS